MNVLLWVLCVVCGLSLEATVVAIVLRNSEADHLAECRSLIEKMYLEADRVDSEMHALKERYDDVDCERDRLADIVCGDVPKSMCYLSREIHKQAVAHGWWDEERSFPEVVALCHSELSEALEEYRDAKPMEYVVIEKMDAPDEIETDPLAFGERKPEGAAVEMADCIIRILDWCGKAGVDIDDVVERKMAYNATRPYKHGGKVC